MHNALLKDCEGMFRYNLLRAKLLKERASCNKKSDSLRNSYTDTRDNDASLWLIRW